MKFSPFKIQRPSGQALATGLIIALGTLAGAYLLRAPAGGAGAPAHADHASPEEAAEHTKGPHGGRLFRHGDMTLELAIFEQGVEPEFRLYLARQGKPVEPARIQASVTLERLGREPEVFQFIPAGDHLRGRGVVREPHSFAVKIAAHAEGQALAFSFEQIEARVGMSEAQRRDSGIALAAAGSARIQTGLQLIGEIRLNEDKTVRIVPRLQGLVEAVMVSAGDRVRKGQLLAVLSSQSLADQRGAWLAAEKRLAMARDTHAREKTLWEEKISAEQDYLQARQALREAEIVAQSARQKLAALGAAAPGPDNLTRYEIRAPIDGVIVDKRVAVGEVLKEDGMIFVLADMATVWVDATVPAKDLNAVRTGQRATVRATAFEAEAGGIIGHVGAVVGEQTRTALARLVLPNPQGIWRPGLPVNVQLVVDEVTVPLAVAADAIQSLRDWQVVFVRHGEQFEARPVKTGRGDGRMVEILDGLLPGEPHATHNSYLLKADIGKSGASHDH